jgi:hypothetical protein
MDTSSIKAKEKEVSSMKEATIVSANHHADADILFALQNYVPDTAEEKRLVRKIDFILLPILWWMYILAHLDRSNIANANAAGMSEDLGLSDNRQIYVYCATQF